MANIFPNGMTWLQKAPSTIDILEMQRRARETGGQSGARIGAAIGAGLTNLQKGRQMKADKLETAKGEAVAEAAKRAAEDRMAEAILKARQIGTSQGSSIPDQQEPTGVPNYLQPSSQAASSLMGLPGDSSPDQTLFSPHIPGAENIPISQLEQRGPPPHIPGAESIPVEELEQKLQSPSSGMAVTQPEPRGATSSPIPYSPRPLRPSEQLKVEIESMRFQGQVLGVTKAMNDKIHDEQLAKGQVALGNFVNQSLANGTFATPAGRQGLYQIASKFPIGDSQMFQNILKDQESQAKFAQPPPEVLKAQGVEAAIAQAGGTPNLVGHLEGLRPTPPGTVSPSPVKKMFDERDAAVAAGNTNLVQALDREIEGKKPEGDEVRIRQLDRDRMEMQAALATLDDFKPTDFDLGNVGPISPLYSATDWMSGVVRQTPLVGRAAGRLYDTVAGSMTARDVTENKLTQAVAGMRKAITDEANPSNMELKMAIKMVGGGVMSTPSGAMTNIRESAKFVRRGLVMNRMERLGQMSPSDATFGDVVGETMDLLKQLPADDAVRQAVMKDLRKLAK